MIIFHQRMLRSLYCNARTHLERKLMSLLRLLRGIQP